MRTPVCLAVLLGALGTGCGEEDHFFPPQAFAMTSDMAPVVEGIRISYWQVQLGYELPLRTPTGKDLERINESRENPPEPWLDRMPWIDVGDLEIEIEYTLTNVADADSALPDDYDDNVDGLAVEILVDAWTEFHEYVPGITIVNQREMMNLSGSDNYVLVPPAGRVTGSIRMDEMEELAYDFSAILANQEEVNANCVVYRENDHEDETRCQYASVPDTVPGLVGFMIGMRTTEAADLALEFIVRVRDAKGKLWIDADDKLSERLELPDREIFTPIAIDEYE